jgi:protease I
MEHPLEGMKVAILAADGVEERELTEPRQALDAAGAETKILSPSERWIKAWDRKDWGSEFLVDIALQEGSPGAFDALVIPGGVMSTDHLRREPEAVRFVRHFFDTGKPVASICHGPQLQIDAEVVRGRKITSHPAIRRDLENAGATWVDAEVVEDGNLVTSRDPEDLPAFIEKVTEHFAEKGRRFTRSRRA